MPYAVVMDWDLRQLRFFVTAAEQGSFTEAAAQLFVSQAAVSRTIAGLERAVGETLLRRIPRGCELTATGRLLLPHAHRVLAEADRFSEFLESRRGTLRLGYAWAALGRHTVRLQNQWRTARDSVDLQLIRHSSATSGLAEGLCDVAVVRVPVDESRFGSVVVGLEDRVVAFAADDERWSRRRRFTMAEVGERTVLFDPRGGTTTEDLWDAAGRSPSFRQISDIDSWLDTIAAGRAVGTTSEATAYHHPRPGVVYRPIKDGPRIPVRLAWWRDQRPAGLSDLISTVTQLYAQPGRG